MESALELGSRRKQFFRNLEKALNWRRSTVFVAVVVVGQTTECGVLWWVLTVGLTHLRGRRGETIRNQVLDEQMATNGSDEGVGRTRLR